MYIKGCILVAPRGHITDPGDIGNQLNHLPLLRYARSQLISQQIDSHLSRNKVSFDDRFEIGSHLALMAMVARRIGWAITTPLGYMRAIRFHDEIDAFPLPFGGFSRRISLFAQSDWPDTVPLDVADTMRRLTQSHVITPAINRLPWLAGKLQLID